MNYIIIHVYKSLGKLRAIKKVGEEITFDLLNINKHNIKDVVLRGQMNQKTNAPPQKICGTKVVAKHIEQRMILAIKLSSVEESKV
jgi:hypothetical protein